MDGLVLPPAVASSMMAGPLDLRATGVAVEGFHALLAMLLSTPAVPETIAAQPAVSSVRTALPDAQKSEDMLSTDNVDAVVISYVEASCAPFAAAPPVPIMTGQFTANDAGASDGTDPTEPPAPSPIVAVADDVTAAEAARVVLPPVDGMAPTLTQALVAFPTVAAARNAGEIIPDDKDVPNAVRSMPRPDRHASTRPVMVATPSEPLAVPGSVEASEAAKQRLAVPRDRSSATALPIDILSRPASVIEPLADFADAKAETPGMFPPARPALAIPGPLDVIAAAASERSVPDREITASSPSPDAPLGSVSAPDRATVMIAAEPERKPQPQPAPAPLRQVAQLVMEVTFDMGKDQALSVMLDPASLGRVEISIERQGDTTQVRVLAERPETLLLFQRDARELDRMLDQAGIAGAGRALSFGLAPGGDNGQPREDRRRHGAPRRSPMIAMADPAPRRASRGLIDMAL